MNSKQNMPPAGNQFIDEFAKKQATDSQPPSSAPHASLFSHSRTVDRSPFDPKAEAPYASDTITGSTSQELHDPKNLGMPIQGETSSEERHDGSHGRKGQGQGVDQWGEGKGDGSFKEVDLEG